MEHLIRTQLRHHPRLWIATRAAKRVVVRPFRAAKRVTQRQQIDRYLAVHASPRIILGAGPSRHDGWLSTDISPGSAAAYLDVTKPFPIATAAVDYYHCEHMIEHIGWYAALDLAKEMRRTLRPGGVARIATPDLGKVAALLEAQAAPACAYVEAANEAWAARPDARTDGSMPVPYRSRAAFVLNRLFYGWGHRFVFDRPTLADLLELAGFAELRWCAVGQSDDPNLRGLERHGERIAESINDYETMVVEAVTR